MGCRKLAYWSEEKPVLRCVRESGEHQKSCVNWYDYGARFYDAALARFHTQDPMTVFTPGISPYSYADNNPIMYIDYYGLGLFSWIKKLFGKKDLCPLNQHKQKASPKVRRKKKKKPTKNLTRRSNDDDDSAERIDMLSIAPLGFSGFEGSVPNRRLVDIPTRVPEYKGKPIEDDESISFGENIQFIENKDSFYDLPAAKKTLAELVKTLKEWPQLKIFIVGNTGSDKKVDGVYYGNSMKALAEPALLNGKMTTTGALMSARARSVYKYLIDKDIDPKRMNYGPGNHYDNPSGRITSFVLKNE